MATGSARTVCPPDRGGVVAFTGPRAGTWYARPWDVRRDREPSPRTTSYRPWLGT